MKNAYSTHYEIVTKINGRAQYVESLSALDDDDIVAKVKVITKNGKEVSRDQVVPDDAWMTVSEYIESERKLRNIP